MKYLPLSIELTDSVVLIVGGGDIALRKATLIAKAGASIVVVAPNVNSALVSLATEVVYSNYHSNHLDHYSPKLVISATDNAELNALVSTDCRKRNLLINAVDQPQDSDIIFPALVERGDLTIAISSSGSSPVLARYWRTKIDAIIPSSLAILVSFLRSKRDEIKQHLSSINDRRRFWERFLDRPQALNANSSNQLQAIFSRELNDYVRPEGQVYLIGAGPGDPDLLTFKAIRLLQQADVVLYDRLVAKPIVEMARRDAEFIYVGKRKNEHVVPQQDINELLVQHAKLGKTVARLKGGDPYIFGRGAEEIETLCDENISFVVVPGITAASGCASYAGIPLTHRDYAQSVRFITGHLKDNSIDLNWASLRDPTQTLVFYMGLGGLSIITSKLIVNGRVPSTPIALVENGTTDEQRVFIGTLDNIIEGTRKFKLKSPTLIIVGDVVLAQPKLRWRNDTIDVGTLNEL